MGWRTPGTVALNDHVRWPGVKQILRVVCQRRHRGRTVVETRYFVTSLPRARAEAARRQALVRGHWGAIENGLHWVRDVVFREDRSTISRGHAPQNFAALRNAALACLRADAAENFAATFRSHSRKPQRLFAKLGLL
ncbi:MAG: ISAs1 family transposase [Planctomycetaceae bacterium]|nr:ISAs1 family transposase [Planctomycetaceae bacterium]